MALTWTDINSITRDYIAPMLVDVVYKASALFVKAKSNNVVRFEGGNRILQPLMWSELNGGAFQRGQPFDTTYVQTDTALQFAIKFYYVNCTLYGPDDVQFGLAA